MGRFRKLFGILCVKMPSSSTLFYVHKSGNSNAQSDRARQKVPESRETNKKDSQTPNGEDQTSDSSANWNLVRQYAGMEAAIFHVIGWSLVYWPASTFITTTVISSYCFAPAVN